MAVRIEKLLEEAKWSDALDAIKPLSKKAIVWHRSVGRRENEEEEPRTNHGSYQGER